MIYIKRKFYYYVNRFRAMMSVGCFGDYLDPNSKILDIGCGRCNISEILLQRHEVVSLDIHDRSVVDGITPRIYDGVNIPYDNDTFDFALIFAVLHHTGDPDAILRQAMRVSNQLIIIEDIYRNKAGKIKTQFLDRLYNFRFKDNPHTNRTDIEWKNTFRRFGLQIRDIRYRTFFGMRQAIYLLQKPNW